MEEYQRDRILSHLSRLVNDTRPSDFEIILQSLRAKGMFNDFMVDEIMNSHKDLENRLRFLYRYVTTRGPKAFQQLCEVLRETGNGFSADFLTGERSPKEDSCDKDLEDEYPYNKEWIVTKATRRMDLDSKRVYKMGSRLKGLALIINIRTFVNNTSEEREGSELDIERLTSILHQLDYGVTVHEDLSAKEIKETLREFAGKEEHNECDSAIVIVMSHGISNFNSSQSETVNIQAYDGAIINSQEIVKQLMAYKCKALQGKPKLFFFQACRGDSYNYPLISKIQPQKDHSQFPNNLQTDGKAKRQSNYDRTDSDIIIGYSTSPGFVSNRDPARGSWYIQTLCRVIAKYAWKEDIISMLEIVDDTLANMNEGSRQTSTISNTVHKKFYFQPGIYDLPPSR